MRVCKTKVSDGINNGENGLTGEGNTRRTRSASGGFVDVGSGSSGRLVGQFTRGREVEEFNVVADEVVDRVDTVLESARSAR